MKLDLDEARQFFSEFFFGEHHLPSKIKPFGEGWYVTTHDELATVDFNALTRLVILAHDRAIRVSVMGWAPKHLRIAIHKRDPAQKAQCLTHPTLEAAIERNRAWLAKNKETYRIRPLTPR